MNKLGLVLCGGGGKGSYQVGVWKAFCDVGLDKYFQTIAGSSVGALNAGLFIQGDVRIAEKIWIEEANTKILTTHSDLLKKWLTSEGKLAEFLSNNIIKKIGKHGFFSRDGLEEIMERYLNCDFIAKSNIEYYVTCVEVDERDSNLSTAKRVIQQSKNILEGYFCKGVSYFKMNNLTKQEMQSILLATSALPIVFESVEINKKKYRDGGILDNTPIKPVVDSGCNIVFVVYLNREDRIDKSLYPNTKIYEIYPDENLGNFKTGTLDFSSNGAKQRIRQGYIDTMDLLKPIVEMMQIQYNIQLNLNKIKKDSEITSKQIEEMTMKRLKLNEKMSGFNSDHQQEELKKRFNL